MKKHKNLSLLPILSMGPIVVFIVFFMFSGCSEKKNDNLVNTVDNTDDYQYKTVTIGTQVWMAENLRVTRYRNGDPITNVRDSAAWNNLTTGAYCDYNNDPSISSVYGRLYNWHALIDIRNIAPSGWHVPNDVEWKSLEMYLGMSESEADTTDYRGTNEGGRLKEAGSSHWPSPNTVATNESGFSALPGGFRYHDGIFSSIGYYAAFWSSTEVDTDNAWLRGLSCNESEVFRNNFSKCYGFSIRCVRD